MADRPILFSAPMVRALLAGTKRQTRRIIKPQPPADVVRHCWYDAPLYGFTRDHDVSKDWHVVRLLAYKGDRLWVKENHAIVPRTAYRMSEGVQQTLRPDDDHDAAVYAAGWERSKPGRWRPSIHMPRWASRLTLTVTDVRVERLQDISEDDAVAEGIEFDPRWDPVGQCKWRHYGKESGGIYPPSASYGTLWDSINGNGSWDADPWVVAYTFTVHAGNIDQIARAA
ncbi:hypothetical protein TAL182_CH03049 [Rhizobium sp. TAL182]|uniref:hypothetical protein n=1 Tax=Rhizobium sp. TAL182 TaxID=2020313 RepID=UPI000A20F673|nr:hypothetical protein [Rhizobium sp. TAL182]ARO24794.1 hypothetical protein TAL182_CH03049 [Rhizobium sp. TAL182]